MCALVDTPCCYMTKLFCTICGLWPYQLQFRKKIIRSLHMLICISYFPPQIKRLQQVWGKDMDAVCMCLAPICTIIVSLSKTITMMLFETEMKMLLREMEAEWRLTSRQGVNTIFVSYLSKARILSITYTGILCYGLVTYITMPAIPLILDVVSPKNETRIRSLSFDLDYGVDMQIYWFWLWLHSSLSAAIVTFHFIAADAMFITFIMYICYLFAITRHKLEHVTDAIDTHNSDIERNFYRCEEQRIKSKQSAAAKNCVLSHERAIECAQLLHDIYTWTLFTGASVNVISISIMALQLVSKMSQWADMMTPMAFLFGIVMHLFFLNLMVQFVLNESLSVHESAYSSCWYNMSPMLQRNIVLILIRSHSPCELTAGRLFVMSLERFCSIIQTSISYFTVLASFR